MIYLKLKITFFDLRIFRAAPILNNFVEITQTMSAQERHSSSFRLVVHVTSSIVVEHAHTRCVMTRIQASTVLD